MSERPVLAFEVTLPDDGPDGPDPDAALAIIVSVLRALDPRLAETATVTDVARLRERLTRAEREAERLKREMDDLRAEADEAQRVAKTFRAEVERQQLLSRTMIQARDELISQVDERNAEVERLRGQREATVTAIEDGIAALDIEHLTAYDAERVARVVGGVFRVDEAKRLRAELAAVKADPVARRAEDGTVTVDWPEGARSCLIARELLDEMVAGANRLRNLVGEAIDAGARNDGEEIARILREVPLGSAVIAYVWIDPTTGARTRFAPQDIEIVREAGLT